MFRTTALLLALSSPVIAEELSPFVESNVIHTMFHEVGHAIINEFRLPVIGQEEDAVDAFATIEVINFFEEDAKDILVDVAASWLWYDAQTDRDDLDFYDIHDLDAQRAYRTICHLYGIDPEANADAAEWAELPDHSLDVCQETGPLAYDSWEVLLENGVLLNEGDPQTNISVTYKPSEDYADQRQALMESKLLDDMAHYAQTNFAWPKEISIVAEECGQANAFWDPQTRMALLCYEIVEEWMQIESEVYSE